MKINIKALQLIEKGLSAKTVSKLNESEINVLHSKLLMSEAVKEIPAKKSYLVDKGGGELPPNAKGYEVNVNTDGTTTVTAKESEVKEEDDFDLDADQAYTGQQGSHDEYQAADDGMDDDTSPENKNRKMVGVTESKKKKVNPWAICTAQLGKKFKTTERHLWNTKQKNKYERCVKDVKQSLKEGKNPVSLFLESKIMNIVEKNIPARITKGDLMKFLQEDTKTAPAKPKTRPKTTPDEKPKTRPKHPGKNPNPGENPAPKAVSPEKAKDEVLDLIMKLLEN